MPISSPARPASQVVNNLAALPSKGSWVLVGGRDSDDSLRDAGFRSGAHRTFDLSGGSSSASVGVLLWQFASPDGADRYAHSVVELLLAEEHVVSSVQEHAARGEEVIVPGFDGARGIVFRGEVSGVEDTYLVAAHEDVVVAVELHELDLGRTTPEDGLNRAAEILQTQIDAREATAGG
jgi:hypothetical protein